MRIVRRPIARLGRRARWHLDVRRASRAARDRAAELAVFHDFVPAPAGGAHQTLRAILDEMARRGVRVEHNALSDSTRAALVNSFNFDQRRLEWFTRRHRDVDNIVHRVGAVTTLYRGFDDGTDARVADINHRYAEATIAISHATVDMYRSIGIELVRPRVIYNGVDPSIFHPRGRAAFDRDRKIRVVAASWSDNARKGGPVYRWLESELDWSRYELTFVGNTQEVFERANVLPPLPSRELADVFRSHDVYITATENDAYSNALVEALSCGLPALYLASGGSAEAVKDAGFGFRDREEIPMLLDRLVDEYEARQAAISLPSLVEVVDAYLETLGLSDFVSR